jgi:MoxR-like ATPase
MMESASAVAPNQNQAGALAENIRTEIGKVMAGQQEAIDQLIMTLFAGGHALIEGVPGLGKTLLAKALAKTFSGASARIQCTPGLRPVDITGYSVPDQENQRYVIRKGPVFTHLLLVDEINRAPASTQAALLEAMQEQQVTIDGRGFPIAAPFMLIATQNPIDLEGTFPLPEGQVDRFLVKIRMDYPSAQEETDLVKLVTATQTGGVLDVSAVNTVVQPADILAIQQRLTALTVDQRIYDYAVTIVRHTREWPGVAMGAGPRGGIALLRMARALALFSGREFVTPVDVKSMAIPCLRHRLALAPEQVLEGHTPDDVLAEILAKAESPRS